MTQRQALSQSTGGTARGPALALDAGLLCILLVATPMTGSLTLLGETLRSALLFLRELSDWMTKKKLLAGSLAHYEFGVEKLAQAWTLAIALAMIIAGLWIAGLALDLIVTGESQTTSGGLALAAVTLALVTLRSGLQMLPFAQPKPRAFRFASLLVMQSMITLAALADDPSIALLADSFGAAFVALLMTAAGARLFSTAAVDLVDHPLNRKSEAYIAELLLEAGVEEEELLDLRTRRSGRDIFVELTINPSRAGSFEEARQRMGQLRRALAEQRDDLDVAIRLRAPGADSG
ncbi:hypothetical protein HBA54_28200 [Pelagibius litoralis]|uniref:Divalent metal cation (Fe/Co/Zn/Cd) transporter n=1 Tax=Pelagibius litoralis TaxID=374515 RepID=A0A967F416_9PROT|nr:hypothetical protein [Pelagibius litoralis]NIA72475.1 hypothetical protein [Pelagibius litoralis]